MCLSAAQPIEKPHNRNKDSRRTGYPHFFFFLWIHLIRYFCGRWTNGLCWIMNRERNRQTAAPRRTTCSVNISASCVFLLFHCSMSFKVLLRFLFFILIFSGAFFSGHLVVLHFTQQKYFLCCFGCGRCVFFIDAIFLNWLITKTSKKLKWNEVSGIRRIQEKI